MLRVLQWNADNLSTQVHELRDRLTRESIDVCLTQGAMLQETNEFNFLCKIFEKIAFLLILTETRPFSPNQQGFLLRRS